MKFFVNYLFLRRDSWELIIRAGEWDTQTRSEPLPHQNRDVSRIIIHPNFKSGNLHNDFAILILSKAVEYAENVDIVCLPDKYDVFDNARCAASGWGKDVFGKYPNFLTNYLIQSTSCHKFACD